MAFAIKASNLAAIGSYDRAVQHFADTPVPRTRKESVWGADCRPLYNPRSQHCALERGAYLDINQVEHTYFQCSLHGTPLVRYFKPDSNGDYAVWLSGYNSISSWAFLSRMGWWRRKLLNADNGESVLLLPSPDTRTARYFFDDRFTTRLVFHANGQLDTKRSVAIPWCRKVTSSTMRDLRAKARERLDIVLNMVEMNYHDILSRTVVDWRSSHPFSSIRVDYSKRARMTANLQAHISGELSGEDAAATMQFIIEYALDYARAASTQMLNKNLAGNTYYRSNRLPDGTSALDLPDNMKETCTPPQESIRRSVQRALLALTGYGDSDKRAGLPMFPTEAPRQIFTKSYSADPEETYGEDVCNKMYSRRGLVY